MSASLQGLLVDFRLPDILSFLNFARRTGRLELVCGMTKTSIFVEAGEVVYADSDDPALMMATLALRLTSLTAEQRARISALSTATVAEFVAGVRNQQVLEEQTIVELQKRRVAEVVYQTFAWSSGSFAFSMEEVPGDAVTIQVALCNLIMEGARRMNAWQECRRLFPNEHVIFRAVRNPQIQGVISLSKTEWDLLLRLDGKFTLHDFASEEDADPVSVYRTFYGLAANQLVEVVPPEEVATRILETENTVETVEKRNTVASDLSLVLSPDATVTFQDVLAQRISLLRDIRSGWTIALVDDEYSVGRRTEADICVEDELVSSYHAVLRRDGDGYVVEDLGSKNGTFVNGDRVRMRSLRHGDSIRVGGTEFRFSTEASMA